MGGTVITRRGNLVVDVENFTKRHLQRPLVVVVGGWMVLGLAGESGSSPLQNWPNKTTVTVTMLYSMPPRL